MKWIEAEKMFKEIQIEKFEKQYKDYRPVKNSCSSVIRMSNKTDIAKLGDYIYNDRLDIGLKRKYDIFLKIKASCLHHGDQSLQQIAYP